ncbi:MAG: hypothetical protein Q7T26_08435 [Dehalococcoidia bacterium]|nr:hypothetical protein [Dehalococcoidia bacterium]
MQDEMAEAERQLMIEGCLPFAQENLEWTQGALPLFLDVLPEWGR